MPELLLRYTRMSMDRNPKRFVEVGDFLHIGLQYQYLCLRQFDKISWAPKMSSRISAAKRSFSFEKFPG